QEARARILARARKPASQRRTKDKCGAEGSRGRYDTSGEESHIHRPHRWSKIRFRRRLLDTAASVGHGAAAAALRGSGKRGCFCEADERSHKMGIAKLKKTETKEKAAAWLRQYGRTLLGLLVFALVVHDIFGTHGYLAMRRTQQQID